MTLVEQLRKLSAENQSPRDCIDEAADVIENLTALINRLRRELAECQAECLEQARLVGMGAERELRLMAHLAESQARGFRQAMPG